MASVNTDEIERTMKERLNLMERFLDGRFLLLVIGFLLYLDVVGSSLWNIDVFELRIPTLAEIQFVKIVALLVGFGLTMVLAKGVLMPIGQLVFRCGDEIRSTISNACRKKAKNWADTSAIENDPEIERLVGKDCADPFQLKSYALLKDHQVSYSLYCELEAKRRRFVEIKCFAFYVGVSIAAEAYLPQAYARTHLLKIIPAQFHSGLTAVMWVVSLALSVWGCSYAGWTRFIESFSGSPVREELKRIRLQREQEESRRRSEERKKFLPPFGS